MWVTETGHTKSVLLIKRTQHTCTLCYICKYMWVYIYIVTLVPFLITLFWSIFYLYHVQLFLLLIYFWWKKTPLAISEERTGCKTEFSPSSYSIWKTNLWKPRDNLFYYILSVSWHIPIKSRFTSMKKILLRVHDPWKTHLCLLWSTIWERKGMAGVGGWGGGRTTRGLGSDEPWSWP